MHISLVTNNLPHEEIIAIILIVKALIEAIHLKPLILWLLATESWLDLHP